MDADMQLGRLEALNSVNVSVVQRKQAYLFDKQVLQLKRAWEADENDTTQTVHAAENPLKVDQYKSMVTS